MHAVWSREHAALLARRDQLLAAMERLEATHGAGLPDEATAGKAADFVLLLEREVRHVEDIRKSVKAPFLVAGRTLDRLLKTETSDRLAAAAAAARVAALLTDFQIRKIAAEREAREHAAQAAREAADALAIAAQADPALREQAPRARPGGPAGGDCGHLRPRGAGPHTRRDRRGRQPEGGLDL